MQQHPCKELTAGGQTHAPRRRGVWYHDTVGRKASLRKWGTMAAAGALLALLWAGSDLWYGVASGSVAAGMARGSPHLLAVGIGTLSWLAGVVIVAALLFGAMLLLHALVQLYPVSFAPFPLRGRFTRQKTGARDVLRPLHPLHGQSGTSSPHSRSTDETARALYRRRARQAMKKGLHPAVH